MRARQLTWTGALGMAFFLAAGQAAEVDKLPFDTYSGYFVSNKFESNAAASFLVIGDRARFNKVFGAAVTMRDTAHRLARGVFKENVVLAVVKRGKALWTYQVEGVTAAENVVVIRYKASARKSDSATYASPLIVSIPKVKFTAVRFVENGKRVKEVEVGKK